MRDDRPSAGAAPEAPGAAAKPERQDVVVLGPPTADGNGIQVLRARDERIEAGELRELREGRPVVGELVTLAPREGNPRVLDVKESWPATGSPRKGPAQIASKAYRDGWDEIFRASSEDAERLEEGATPRRDLN